jgi:BirA family biotin operon repressor/biotin-[acetyl-CoA-carboxylase] ligase
MPRNSRQELLLEALREAAPGPVSGETLAALLGVSRVAVGKRVNALRTLGYTIDATAGVGYVLSAAPDLPLPAEVAPLLTTPFWGPLHGGGTTGSTNDDCKALAREGAPEGTVVLAARQTGGRGRFGRQWESPEGGVYLSALLRPPLAPAELAPLSLVAGLGLVRALATLGVEAYVKWPNDVFSAEGKLAGVLLEVSAEAEAVEWAVVGCGVNVRCTPGMPSTAACVDGLVPEPPRLAQVAAACLDGLAAVYGEFLAGGFAALRSEYERRAWLTAREVTVRDAMGQVRAAGRVAGVDESGRLVVEGPTGPVSVVAGEVTLRQ